MAVANDKCRNLRPTLATRTSYRATRLFRQECTLMLAGLLLRPRIEATESGREPICTDCTVSVCNQDPVLYSLSLCVRGGAYGPAVEVVGSWPSWSVVEPVKRGSQLPKVQSCLSKLPCSSEAMLEAPL